MPKCDCVELSNLIQLWYLKTLTGSLVKIKKQQAQESPGSLTWKTKMERNKKVLTKCHHPLAAMFFPWSQLFSNSSEISIKPIIWQNFMMIEPKKITSRVFTSFFYYINIKENQPPPLPSDHVILAIRTIFRHNQWIIYTNIMTNLHKDWPSNMTSSVDHARHTQVYHISSL